MINVIKKNQIMAVLLLFITSSLYASIEPTSGRYIETVEDLSVQVIGASLVWEREYRERRWTFNKSWQSLIFEHDISTGQVSRILRGGDSYEKLDSAGTLFKFGPKMRIKRNSDGSWTWQDRSGNRTEYAANGQTLSLHHQAGNYLSLIYNGDDKLSGVKDVHDQQVLWITYDPLSGQIATVKDYGNREVKYTWSQITGSTHYKLIKVTDARGYDWQYDYTDTASTDGRVRLIKKTDPEQRNTQISYSGSGRVKSITDALGQVTSYRFDYLKSRKEYYLKVSYPGGRVTESWYARDGKLTRKITNGIELLSIARDLRKDRITDTFGRTTVQEYDEFRNPLKVTYPDGSSISTTYDISNSNILTQTDERGTVTRYEYYPNGRLKKMTEALDTAVERSTEYSYDQYGQMTHRKQPSDAQTASSIIQYFYDAHGNLAKIINAENHTIEYNEHDSMGNPLRKTDANTQTWIYSYDALGNRTGTTSPLQHSTAYQYDKVGNLSKITYPDDASVEYQYDPLNRLIKQIDELKHAISYAYDPAGNQTKVTDKAQRTTTHSYDLLNRLTQTTDSGGNSISYLYPQVGDPQGYSVYRPKQINYPTSSIQIKYDLKGRVIEQSTTYPKGNQQTTEITKYQYDLNGNLIATTDPEQRTITAEYDVLNRLIKSTEPNNIQTQLTYNAKGDMLSLTDALQHTHTFSYNRLGQKLSETRPLGQTTNYTYDANGNLSSQIDSKGQKTEYSYDAANRNSQIKYYKSDQTLDKTITFEYDQRDNLRSYNDGTSQATYSYDKAQQKLTESVQYDGQSFSHSYSYHPDGQQASYTGIDGITYSYYYNNTGSLSNIVIPNEGNISYQNFQWNRPQIVTYPGNIRASYSYDGLQRITGIQVKTADNQTLMDYSYSYTPAGNISTKNTEHGNYSYSYDQLNRLTAAAYPNLQDESFSYDALGNRITDSNTGVSQWIYNQNNQLLNSVTHQYEYDANGNQTLEKDPQGQILKQYLYNTQNRLSEIKDGNNQTIARYTYDPFGRRLSKTISNADQSSTTTYFHYNDQGYAGEQTDGQITGYLFHPQYNWSTNPILKHQNQNHYYYQTDHLGTPNILHDKQGQIVNAREMKAFGEWTNSINTVKDNMGFPGQYLDTESGTHYNYHRDYEPTTGRYLQSDPIGLDGGWNIYGYVLANPVNWIDVFGLATNTVVCKANGGMSIFLGADSSGGVCGLSKCIVKHEMCHVKDLAKHSDAKNFCSDPRNAEKPVEIPVNESNKRFKQETELNGIGEELECLKKERRRQSPHCKRVIDNRIDFLKPLQSNCESDLRECDFDVRK